jgi:hypothetical protein
MSGGHFHPLLEPHSPWGHLEVEGRLVQVHDVGVRLLHDHGRHLLAELLLLLQEQGHTLLLCNVGALGLAEGGSMFQVDLPYEPRGQLLKAQPLSPVLGTGLKGQVHL